MGTVEQRGNSIRVVHTDYDLNGKRIFTKHTIKGNGMGTMGTAMGTEKAENRLISDYNIGENLQRWGGGDSNPRPPAPQAGIMDQARRPPPLLKKYTF